MSSGPASAHRRPARTARRGGAAGRVATPESHRGRADDRRAARSGAGRRLGALRVFCMFGGAFALAGTGKKLIGERRPPMGLWAIQAGCGASYPGGHASTAAVLAVAVIIIAAIAAWRYTAIVIGQVATRSPLRPPGCTWPAITPSTCPAEQAQSGDGPAAVQDAWQAAHDVLASGRAAARFRNHLMR
jgi:hypothetical protein